MGWQGAFAMTSKTIARRAAAFVRIGMVIALNAGFCVQASAAQFNGGPGTDILVGTFVDDTFRGGPGNDTLVGDFLDSSVEDFSIPCRAGAGVESQAIDGPNGQTTSTLNDVFDDGPGNDLIIGDAGITVDFDEFQLFAGSGTGAKFGGAGGDFNSARCFADSNLLNFAEDSFRGGPGNDTFVGDAFYSNSQPEDLNLDAGAGSASMGQLSFYPYRQGGDGGDNNSLDAFGDFITFEAVAGAKLLVGDAYSLTPRGSEDHLVATAGAGAQAGARGGNTNTVGAFNDQLRGGAGADRIYGDDFRSGGNGDALLVANAGSGGEGAAAGAGGANNTLQAFADQIAGNSGNDFIAGDAVLAGLATDNLGFVILTGFSQPGGGAGSSGNTVSAFQDSLSGGVGDDTIIGEGENVGDNESIRIMVAGDAGNSVAAFGDAIDGGVGNDRLYGDFRYAPDACNIDAFDISGGANASVFSDRIRAGLGNDSIHGGFGADDMAGQGGRDTYLYFGPDLAEVAAGAGAPVDVIQDFQVTGPIAERDIFDLRPLLVSCHGLDIPGGDNRNDWIRIVGTSLQVDLDGPGGAFGWVSILTAPSLAGTNVTFLRNNQNLVP